MRCRNIVPSFLMFALFVLLASAVQALPPIGSVCDSAPCENGGNCLDTGASSYLCECPSGFTGTNCEIEIDECESSPCVNGDCQDGPNRYECLCYPGWTGTTCEVDIDECESSPCVNGLCEDKVNSYRCHCLPGFTGPNCDVDIDECASNPCIHGECNDQVNGYSCSCEPGYSGPNCDVPIVTLDCSDAVADPGQLWPPNHQLVPISVLDVAGANGGTVTITVTGVFQDEPVNGTGDGDTSPDATGVGTATASVRSERAGNGNGRVYHLSFSATSSNGGSCSGEVTVGVPKSQGKKGGPIDGGSLYDSTQP